MPLPGWRLRRTGSRELTPSRVPQNRKQNYLNELQGFTGSSTVTPAMARKIGVAPTGGGGSAVTQAMAADKLFGGPAYAGMSPATRLLGHRAYEPTLEDMYAGDVGEATRLAGEIQALQALAKGAGRFAPPNTGGMSGVTGAAMARHLMGQAKSNAAQRAYETDRRVADKMKQLAKVAGRVKEHETKYGGRGAVAPGAVAGKKASAAGGQKERLIDRWTRERDWFNQFEQHRPGYKDTKENEADREKKVRLLDRKIEGALIPKKEKTGAAADPTKFPEFMRKARDDGYKEFDSRYVTEDFEGNKVVKEGAPDRDEFADSYVNNIMKYFGGGQAPPQGGGESGSGEGAPIDQDTMLTYILQMDKEGNPNLEKAMRMYVKLGYDRPTLRKALERPGGQIRQGKKRDRDYRYKGGGTDFDKWIKRTFENKGPRTVQAGDIFPTR